MAEGVDTESHMKCGICLSFYTEPRLLSCYHVFCTPCLETLTSSSNDSECPLCRRKIVLTEDGIKGLALYPATSTGNTDDKGLDVCDLCCDEKRAIAKCTECNVNLCVSCREYHVKLKSSRNHNINGIIDQEGANDDNKGKENVCDLHKKALELFCFPCYEVICNDCQKHKHSQHKIKRFDLMMEMKRNEILAKNSSLRCRIPILENAKEKTNMEENHFSRMTMQVKKEMKSYANGLKEVICKTIDSFTNQQEQIIEITKKTDLKKIQIYKEELETEQMSVSRFTETVDQMVKTYSDEANLKALFKLEDRLDHHLKKRGTTMPAVNDIQFEYGRWNDSNMQELVGRVLLHANTKTMKHSYNHLPQKLSIIKPSKITGFQVPDEPLGIVPANNNTAWVLTAKSINLYNSTGKVVKTCTLPSNSKKVLQKSTDEIWIWCGTHAVKIDTRSKSALNNLKQYKIEFQNAKAGCFIHTGKLVIYNSAEKQLYYVSNGGAVQKLHTSEVLRSILTDRDIAMTETKTFNLVISQGGSRVFIVDTMGTIINVFGDSGAEFEAVTTDNYGNIIVADYQKDYISLLSEDGVLCRILLRNENNSESDDVYGVKHMTIDGCGNLWFSNHHQTIFVYSYI